MTKRLLLPLMLFVCAVVDNKFYSLLRDELYSAIEDADGIPEIYGYNFGMLIVPLTRHNVFLHRQNTVENYALSRC